MASAHIYRDSLHWGNETPNAALLLVPAGGGASWLEDDGLIKQFGVGIVPLAPTGVPDRLGHYFERFLRSVT
jgi:hypothetical protein